jgi:hypothetical protein
VHDAASGRLLRVLRGAHPFTLAAADRSVVYVKRGEIVMQNVGTGDVWRRVKGPLGSRMIAISTSTLL